MWYVIDIDTGERLSGGSEFASVAALELLLKLQNAEHAKSEGTIEKVPRMAVAIYALDGKSLTYL